MFAQFWWRSAITVHCSPRTVRYKQATVHDTIKWRCASTREPETLNQSQVPSPWSELVTRSVSNLACKFKIWDLLAEGTNDRSVCLSRKSPASQQYLFCGKGIQCSLLTCAISRKTLANNKVLDTSEAYLSIPRIWFWKPCCFLMRINTFQFEQYLSCKQQAPRIQAHPRW
jgi:hypothetical protein